MDSVSNIIVVLSGKGGVGKSTLSVQLALGLMHEGHRVGLLDVDLCGPSIPSMLGVEGAEIYQSEVGWSPVFAPLNGVGSKKLAVMSIAFLLKNKSQPVIWRGPKKTSMIKHFIDKVSWGDLDYLVVDTPPGTSDEHITVVEALKLDITKAVIVTTPQMVAIGDVRREIKFCRKAQLEMLGIVENMSGYVCPHCSECTNIFSSGGGEQLAEQEKLDFLGRVPIDPTLAQMLDGGKCFDLINSNGECGGEGWKAVRQVVAKLLDNQS